MISLVRCHRERMQSLPPNESSVYFVPVLHARLAEFPAIENVAPVKLPTEINEARVHPLADDAQVVQLGDVALDVARQPLRFDLQKFSDGIGMIRTRSDRRQLELANLVFPRPVIADEI